MTKAETIELITRIRAYFPSWNPKVTPRELIDTWYDGLRKYEYEPVKDMLARYIEDDKTGFAPAISQLIPNAASFGGFRGRIYSHADFVEMEKDALRSLRSGT